MPISVREEANHPSLDKLAADWALMVGSSKAQQPACNVYAGRSVIDSRWTADAIGGDLVFVSAGLGLVAGTQLIPDYNLTVSDGSGSIAAQLRSLQSSPAAWWSALSAALGQPEPLSRLLTQNPSAIAYVALPAGYLQLLRDELVQIAAAHGQRLRLFSGGGALNSLPSCLHDALLPYDDRLEAVHGFAGTRSDFAQRALRHYVQVLKGHDLSLADGRAAVLRSLNTLKRPITPTRVRLTDDQIAEILRTQWDAYRGESTRLLRHLRDVALVACEQSRFRSIWLGLKAERQTLSAA